EVRQHLQHVRMRTSEFRTTRLECEPSACKAVILNDAREDPHAMANRLQNKVALITAAGQGIGRAIAEAFVAEGARVIATDVEESKLEGLKSLQRRKLDVRSIEAVEALGKEVAAEFGALGILVNCAGYVHHGSVLECSEKDWDFSFDLNV